MRVRETGAAVTPATSKGCMHPIAKWPLEGRNQLVHPDLRTQHHITPLETDVKKKKKLPAFCPFDSLVLCDMPFFSLYFDV